MRPTGRSLLLAGVAAVPTVVALLGSGEWGAPRSRMATEPCVASPGAPALDHAVLVARDLDGVAAAFERLGFRLKPGRLHANNLLNRHVKFSDGTSLELMTVRGAPGDPMAEDYAALIRAGEGGVYVALETADLAGAEATASALGLETLRSGSGPWRFLSFPASSPAAGVFFSSGGVAAQDPDSLVTHGAPVTGVAEVWLEGGAELQDLLAGLGAARCDTARGPDGRGGRRWALARGAVVVVPAPAGARPRVLGAVLASPSRGAATTRPLPGFWLRYP